MTSWSHSLIHSNRPLESPTSSPRWRPPWRNRVTVRDAGWRLPWAMSRWAAETRGLARSSRALRPKDAFGGSLPTPFHTAARLRATAQFISSDVGKLPIIAVCCRLYRRLYMAKLGRGVTDKSLNLKLNTHFVKFFSPKLVKTIIGQISNHTSALGRFRPPCFVTCVKTVRGVALAAHDHAISARRDRSGKAQATDSLKLARKEWAG